MFDIPSIRLGRLFGIPLEVNLSWIVIFVLVAVSLGGQYFPTIEEAAQAPSWARYLVGALTTLAFFASIVAHELSHSLVARLGGGKVDKITLFIFGGVAQIDEEPTTPGREFVMAFSGPAMSFLLSVVLFLGYLLAADRAAAWWVWGPLRYLAGINLAVAVFNLLPGFPLDGGRVLRSVLWAVTKDLLRATRWAVRVGQALGWSLVVISLVRALNGSADLIWFGIIGWFIATLAGAAYRQQVFKSKLAGVPVSQIMTPGPEYVDGSISLEQFVHDHLLARQHSRYPVMFEGNIVGLVSLPDVKRVDRAEWPFIRVIDVTDRDIAQLIVNQDDMVESIIGRLAVDRPGALMVVGDGRMVGVITRADVIELLQAGEA